MLPLVLLLLPSVWPKLFDLHNLYCVWLFQVIKDRKWKEVIGAFNFRNTITSASFVLRKYYLKFLYQLEHVYYFQKPASSIQSTGLFQHQNPYLFLCLFLSLHVLLRTSQHSHDFPDEAMKNLASASPNPEEGIRKVSPALWLCLLVL